jgi:NADH dehydrogenase
LKISTSKKRIIILGAGYAGMFLATNLAQHVKKEKADLILVDRNSYHQLLLVLLQAQLLVE